VVTQAQETGIEDGIQYLGGDVAMQASKKFAELAGIYKGTGWGGSYTVSLRFSALSERHLPTRLFEDIFAGMAEEKKALELLTFTESPPGRSLPNVRGGREHARAHVRANGQV
jgi:hypothetical protein